MLTDSKGRMATAKVFNGSTLTMPQATQGFFNGRCYRAYREFTGAFVLKFVATRPFMLTHQSLSCDTGAAKVLISVGSTEGGTFVALPTKFAKNGVVAPVVAADVVITQNGTATAGTEREVIRAAAPGGASNLLAPRYLPAGTYYMNGTVTGSTTGIYAIEWEELDVAVS